MTQLVEPTAEYKDSYLAAFEKFQAEGSYTDLNIEEVQSNFAAYLSRFSEMERGENLAEGFPPVTHRWLVDESNFIGHVFIRHELTEKVRDIGHIGFAIRPSYRKQGFGTQLLGDALHLAGNIGIKTAVLMCAETNLASCAVIERNGGILKDKREIDGTVTQVYHIDTPN